MGCCQSNEIKKEPLIALSNDKKIAIEQLLGKYDSPLRPTDYNLIAHRRSIYNYEEWHIGLRISNRYTALVEYKGYPVYTWMHITIHEEEAEIARGQIKLNEDVEASFYHLRWNDDLNDRDIYELLIHCLTCCCEKIPPSEKDIKLWKSRSSAIHAHHQQYLAESQKKGYTDIEGVCLIVKANNRHYIRNP